MSTLASRYRLLYGLEGLDAPVAFCRDLMRGNPNKLQIGYTAPNAILAAVETFGLDEADKPRLAAALIASEVTP